MFELTCTSTGGPVSQIMWMYENNSVNITDYNPFPDLINATQGSYRSTLRRQGRFPGQYTCTLIVPDRRGNSTDYHVQSKDEDNHTDNFYVHYYLSHIIVLEGISAKAVWRNYRDIFHICWNDSSYMKFDDVTFRIMDDNYHELYVTDSPSTSTYALDLEATSNIRDSSNITIQALSNSALPSLPQSVTISG